MNLTLEKFGFGLNFRNAIKMLYKNSNNSVTNNGWVSESFTISRGIRQGCPISALLYILSAEIMAENIRNNRTIRGIKIGRNHEIKLTQLADDTTIFLQSENSIPILIEELKRFSEVSGLILNMSKTKGLLLGRNRRHIHKIHGIDFSLSTIKALGIYFSTNRQECMQLNLNKLIEDIQNLLSSWKRRKLTYIGKITVIKALALPKCNYMYLLQRLTPTKEILDKIERLFFKFLWDDKNDRIKRKQIIQSYENGGLKMPDIKSQLQTLQIKWINRLISKEDMSWKIIPTYYFDKYGKNFLLFKMNTGVVKNLAEIKLPHFYRSLLETWLNAGGGASDEIKSFTDIRNQIIWGNQYIKCNGKCLLYKHWIDYNMIYVNDIIFPNGELNSLNIRNKLTEKRNWISDLYRLKRAIQTHLKIMLKGRNSTQTIVKSNAGFTLNNPKLNTKLTLETHTLVNNKQVSDYLVKRDYIKPLMEQYWVTKFNISSSRQYWSKVYTSLFDNLCLTSNNLIEFRYKLLNSILPCKELLFKWRLSDNPLCQICHIQENYEHMFIECPIVNQLWVNVENSLRKSYLSVSVKKLQYLLVGYKP